MMSVTPVSIPSRFVTTITFICLFCITLPGQPEFPFTASPLTEKADLSAKMVEGVDKFLMHETEKVTNLRSGIWQRDFSSGSAFQKSIASERALLAKRLGVVEVRVPPQLEISTNFHSTALKQFRIELPACSIIAVQWKVLDGLTAEGILLLPKGKVRSRIVMIPDADVLPEVLAGLSQSSNAGFGAAQQLANAGCEVIIPTLISRDDRYSGNKSLNLFTNQPHREWLYRQGYEVGRHVIGYELQKIFSAIDWFVSRNSPGGNEIKIGVAGHGEGGLLALYAAALDERISSTLVSGYFDNRERLWQEPIYRNVFGLLNHFGDAEIAVMAWPRKLTIEYAQGPEKAGPTVSAGRAGAAPGLLITPTLISSKSEFDRAKKMVPGQLNHLRWISNEADKITGSPFSVAAINTFMKGLPVEISTGKPVLFSPRKNNEWVGVDRRQERSVREMETHIQRVLDLCHRTRDKNFWQTLKGKAHTMQAVKASHRKALGEVIGELPSPIIPANPKARLLEDNNQWTSYEITLDVYSPDVFAWGILVIPKGIKPGEKRSTVVCQHGLEGVPADVLTRDPNTSAYNYYKSFAVKLAEKGYVTFAPHNYYRGEDKFRVLQRKANPIGLTLFSVITSQHRRIIEWLGQQSFVDPKRIGFYGLSYGGKTAMRVPALVEGYALSICSADFNEWIIKNASIDYPQSYLYTGEYDMPEWDLGHTFSYAEMAALIAPRPFMVERGHYDGVSIDELVDFEYAKVRRHYLELGIPEKTSIEHFNGPHTINGIGTFEFLDKHLKNVPR